MPNPIDANTSKHLAPCVTFAWGHNGVHKSHFIRWECDLDAGGTTFAACPELTIESEAFQGGTDDSPFTVTLGIDRYPIYLLARPYAFATIDVTISEVDPYDPAGTYREMLNGQIRTSTRNADGLKGMARLTCVGVRERLAYPLGLPCLTTCAHHFGDEGCAKDVAALAQTATISAVVGTKIYVAGLTRPRSDYFTAGEAFLDGLSITISKDPGGAYVRMSKPPPPEWSGQAASFIPGCLKTLAACQAWHNESRFWGLGLNMPVANSQVEGQATA